MRRCLNPFGGAKSGDTTKGEAAASSHRLKSVRHRPHLRWVDLVPHDACVFKFQPADCPATSITGRYMFGSAVDPCLAEATSLNKRRQHNNPSGYMQPVRWMLSVPQTTGGNGRSDPVSVHIITTDEKNCCGSVACQLI
jgi:hypothetical protein